MCWAKVCSARGDLQAVAQVGLLPSQRVNRAGTLRDGQVHSARLRFAAMRRCRMTSCGRRMEAVSAANGNPMQLLPVLL